ncbi:glycosyltransferase [Pantoea sp. Taur]|uniref:glycosyltransferase n=1 Tax=Pantoea sp. Taur TaxID=2576757 RepID=UPI001355532E|nr:glycosyltransferase [Pantoea sp. Taur]MXP59066.1 glycosyltransferase [Pantoea sp. Taur]
MHLINVYCQNKGWLFNDLKEKLTTFGCTPSTLPFKKADIWLCIRSSELKLSPDITRTIVQVHNMEPHDIHLFNAALGVIFTHPMQEWLWKRSGFNGSSITVPIGTRAEIKPFKTIPDRPTVGFFCGENKLGWKGSSTFKKVVLAAKKDFDFDVLMIGRGLEHIEDLGVYEKRAAGPDDYSRIDVLFTASISPGVPLSVYEACACGKSVVTTPRWFPSGRWTTVKTGQNNRQLVNHLKNSLLNREKYLESSEKLSFSPYTLEDWTEKNIKYCNTQLSKRFD